ncbi:MAG: hypothetical protein H7A32_02275, partial [Deltaproteobacteria bacterium]|nr:hypothetical protein [Deltaproteobacteria bacterium]
MSRVTVSSDHPVYRYLDKLAAYGLLKSRIKGQGPYTRSEIVALIREALDNYPSFEGRYRSSDVSLQQSPARLMSKVYIDRIIRRLKQEFPELEENSNSFLKFQALEKLNFSYNFLDQEPQIIVSDNGLGSIDAEFQSFTQHREGRRYQKGHNFSFETQHWVSVGDILGLQVQPRFQMQVARPPYEDETKAYLQRGSLHLSFHNLQLQLGRESVQWGPAAWGGLMLSNHARPLDHFLLSSDRPFRLPGSLKALGYFKLSFLAANLGPEHEFPYAWLLGYRISHTPTHYFEWGMSHLTQLGGQDAPEVNAGRFFRELFSWNDSEKYANLSFSFDFRGNIPQWRHLELYTELHFEDIGPDFATTFSKNASYLFGVYAPRLNNSGSWDGRLELMKTGARYGRHQVFRDGMTLNQKMLGASVGPDAWSLRLQFFH